PCIDARLGLKTQHRWRWHVFGNGGGGAYGNDTMYDVSVALKQFAVGFGDPKKSGDLLLLSSSQDVTYVKNYQGEKIVDSKLIYAPYALGPKTDKWSSIARVFDFETDDYWVDMEITTGDAKAIRVDVWVTDLYVGWLTLQAEHITQYQPITLPIHFP